jgi:hypothetical protein
MAGETPGDVVDDAVPGWELTGQEGCPVRRAQRHGVKRVDEQGAFPRQPVDIRSLEIWMPAGAELIPAHVVDDDDDQIGTIARRLRFPAGPV